jgi:NADPH:quinone reductase-like Zn-dependent oxidoreductase
VHAASLNSGDLDYLHGRPGFARMGTGLRKPKNRLFGLDLAGDVEAVGPAATRIRVGERVFGDLTLHGYGAFAEYACAPERAFSVIPASVSYEDASTIPQSGIIALQGLRDKRSIRAGDRLLINGASGCVGPFAVQIAKSLGAEVTGVCSTKHLDLVRSIGADHVIDYTREDYTQGGQRYDHIIDISARRSLFACRRALSSDGAYVMVGGTTSLIFQGLLLGPLLSLLGKQRLGILWGWKPADPDDMAELGELAVAGVLKPIIHRRYPFDQVIDAIRYLDGGRVGGKIVITF